MKKGQITVMLIIIMVLLLIFGLMSYFKARTTEQQGEQEIQEQRMSRDAIQPIQDYVTQCLDLWALRGLELLGKQGGVIFKSQGGLVDETILVEGKDYLFFPAENAKIAYANERVAGKENIPNIESTLAFQPPLYPYTTFPWRSGLKSEEALTGITKLNLLNASSPDAVTLKENIESFVTKQVIDCVDWSAFTIANVNTSDDQAAATTEVVLGDEHLRFFLTYPITLTQKQSGASITVSNFTVEYPFKLKKFFEFVNQVIDQDNRNISFSPRNMDTGTYTVSVIEQANTNFPRDDVLRFVDKTSLILDKPYVFYVARQNRPPALWLLNQTEISTKKVCTLCSSGLNGTTSSIINVQHDESYTTAVLRLDNSECETDDPLIDSNSHDLALVAQDPDEDEVHFFISGTTSASSPTHIPMRTNIFSTLPAGAGIGERIHEISVWVNDSTPLYGLPYESWREYQNIELTFEENVCA